MRACFRSDKAVCACSYEGARVCDLEVSCDFLVMFSVCCYYFMVETYNIDKTKLEEKAWFKKSL